MFNIKPKEPDVRVRKPDGSHLEPEGESVTRSSYWLRRLRDGDVELIVADDDKPAAQKQEKK
ncbi:DUF2635 domain-containing protein [Moritella viscosa]|uniref:DUF2635 domain-containing protein n=1 Tax=Moritella viscosa TaxID=80854 RepID=A0ABY1H8L6_9GAMM|nr:DUF2635 domain-containing protein [Moritella viscosa]CED61138.1 bacteriophage Mu-like gp38 protein [Moritella viscosa]SGY85080.1 Putative uncharacterized protein [Moritella viscosa]SGY87267.1 Putative uncharacterized protein [Moritella viscosa]SHN99426.1 Putative uncharacterized protein [Moritella viscosa]SHO20105.1 Putative uncharacterized protein [Moritella viscosa]